MNNGMKEVKEELREIKEELSKLTFAVSNLHQQCSRMNGHIDFVEGTYSSLRTPLDFLRQRVNYLTGSNVPSLPAIEGADVYNISDDAR